MECVKGQDSLTFYRKINNQYNKERTFGQIYYYNPANMPDYSNYSFSSLNAGYQKEKKQKYLLQEGSGFGGLIITVDSYQKLKNNQSIWGEASYKNYTFKNVKWNDNVDWKIISPYVVADSIGGKMKQEEYQFEGSYSKNFHKFSLGVKANYVARMNYRDYDPRPKNISSTIEIDLGVSYNFHKDYKIGAFGKIYKYTQNNTIKFASEIERAYIYQMTGLGNWNQYFSSKTTKSIYEGVGYRVGGIFNKNKENFVITASLGNFDLDKDVRISTQSDPYAFSKLNNRDFSLQVLKLFDINNHTFGAKVNYTHLEKKGTEIYYTYNDKYLTKLLEKQLYNFEETQTIIEGFYQYRNNNFHITAQPLWGYQQTKEKRKEPDTRQNFTYNYYGISITYYQKLNKTNLLTIRPDILIRNVAKSKNGLKEIPYKEAINQWITNDFNILSSNYTSFGAIIRYDVQFRKLPAFYTSMQFQQITYNTNKHNENYGLTIGITF